MPVVMTIPVRSGAHGIQEREPGCRSPGPLYYSLVLPPDGPVRIFRVVHVDVVVPRVLLEATNDLGVSLGAATGSAEGRFLERHHYRTRLAWRTHVDMGRCSRCDILGGKRVANRIWGNHNDSSAPAAIGVAWSGRFF